MSNATLHKYRTLRPLNEPETTDAMLRILVEIPNEQQDRFWFRTDSGSVCIWKHESFPGKVIEYVLGSDEDSVTTLFEDSPLFATPGDVERMRKDLITEISVIVMALPSSIGIFDEGRGRACALPELGTAQLQDVLAHYTGTDLNTL